MGDFIKKKYFECTSGAFFGAMAIFATVITGAYISLYSSTIVTQFDEFCLPVLLPCKSEELPEITIAFISVVALAFALFLREHSVGKANNSARNRLQEVIKSTPSKSFLEHYTALMRSVGTVRLGIKDAVDSGNLDVDKVYDSIRMCLHGVLSLAKHWDGNDGRPFLYRANIMTMVESDCFDPVSISDGSLSNIADIVDRGKLFLYNNSLLVKVRACSGILILEDTSLTVSTNVTFGQSDDSIKDPICFPYTDQDFKGVRFQPIIPGAPACASFGTAQYVVNTRAEIDSFLESTKYKNKEFCDRFRSDVNEYYSSIDEAQSILSIPIQIRREGDIDPQSPDSQKYETIAVLNIYRNKPGIFRDAESAMNFAQMMEPICYHLAKMLKSASHVQ